MSVPNRYYPRFGEGVIKYEPLDLQHRPIPLTPITKRRPKVIVIGAGWGGLSAAMLLQARGFDIIVIEKNNHIGGRNAQIQVGSCTFDVGPTLLMLKVSWK
jgi:NADPH-dependent 2,4-dienoyl-CoA reductase/sulfur reductase-like enzyme